MKALILQHLASFLVGGGGAWALIKSYGLPWAISKLHDELEHEDPDDKALMVALLTWVKRRGPAFGITAANMVKLEEKALAGLPEASRTEIESLVMAAMVKADSEIEESK